MFIIFVESLDLSHSGSRTRDAFLCYLAECLACRHTERWIKTFNTQGQSACVNKRQRLIRVFSSLHEGAQLLFIMLIALFWVHGIEREMGIRAHMACNAQ